MCETSSFKTAASLMVANVPTGRGLSSIPGSGKVLPNNFSEF